MNKLTIIVVSYNEKEYIEMALQSILNQKCKYEYEVIIGDDGSTDGSIDIIKEYANKYSFISYFVMDRSDVKDIKSIIPHIRVTNIVKIGIARANGQYIKILSGDDFLIGESSIEKQIDVLESNEGFVSCYSDYKWCYEDGLEKKVVFTNASKPEYLWGGRYIHISCFMFKKIVEPFILERFADDIGLVFSICEAGPTIHIKEVMFGYRQRPKSIMKKQDRMETCICELMVYQDILNMDMGGRSSMAHFTYPLNYVYFHRNRLDDKKYSKYLENCKKYGNDILDEIKNINGMTWRQKHAIIFRNILSILYRMYYYARLKHF